MGPGELGTVARRCCAVVGTSLRYLVGAVRATAFWGTILLPLVIVGGLVTDAVASAPFRLALLVGLDVLCIVLGRRYHPSG